MHGQNGVNGGAKPQPFACHCLPVFTEVTWKGEMKQDTGPRAKLHVCPIGYLKINHLIT